MPPVPLSCCGARYWPPVKPISGCFWGVALAVLALHFGMFRSLRLLLYDREVALASGIAVGPLITLLLVTLSVAIAASIRLTGALLVDALTILPALAARNLANSLGGMTAWAIGLGLMGNLTGYLLTLLFNQPPGPVLVLTMGTLTLLTYLVRRK